MLEGNSFSMLAPAPTIAGDDWDSLFGGNYSRDWFASYATLSVVSRQRTALPPLIGYRNVLFSSAQHKLDSAVRTL